MIHISTLTVYKHYLQCEIKQRQTKVHNLFIPLMKVVEAESETEGCETSAVDSIVVTFIASFSLILSIWLVVDMVLKLLYDTNVILTYLLSFTCFIYVNYILSFLYTKFIS